MLSNILASVTSRMTLVVLVLLLACSALVIAQRDPSRAKHGPTITITRAPHIPPGENSTGLLEGRVTGLTHQDRYFITVYAEGGGTLWVQPLANSPMTAITSNRRFRLTTHGGNPYWALVCRRGHYDPPATLDSPPVIGDGVVAITKLEW